MGMVLASVRLILLPVIYTATRIVELSFCILEGDGVKLQLSLLEGGLLIREPCSLLEIKRLIWSVKGVLIGNVVFSNTLNQET